MAVVLPSDASRWRSQFAGGQAGSTIRFCLRRFLALVCFLVAAANTTAANVSVFAAASLTDVLKEIAASYEHQTGDKLTFNFGASSLLARQIEEGAPTDIFFSADEAKMDGLEKKGLIAKETRKSVLSNSLVIVVARENGASIAQPEDLVSTKVKRLALAETKTVPAGIYAKEYLERKNLWASVQAKVVPTENVRAALAAVEAGNAEAGIVYKTDAAISDKVRIAYEVPAGESPRISYPVAILTEAQVPGAARRFLQYLDTEASKRVFQKFGFVVRE
jgi:molybdate transport system substrate-binding protein